MKKKIVIIIALIVVVGGAMLVGYSLRGNNVGTVQNDAQNTTPSTQGSTSAQGVATSSTKTAVPANVSVPNKGATSTVLGAAIPVVQAAGDPSGDVSYRSFAIAIKNGAFSPSTVIVDQGDTVNLNLTAVDASYGFNQPDYGFSVTTIPKGKMQVIQFQALQPGNFTFYCASCGGPSKGPVGHIIVVPK